MNHSYNVFESIRVSELAHRKVVTSLILLGGLTLTLNTGHAQSTSPSVLSTHGITFTGLTGPNLGPYAGSLEGAFAVTPTSGTWEESTIYGNPGPSIIDGPVNAPGAGVIQITDSLGRFTFAGFDFSSNNGNSLYDVEGFLGGALAYEQTGELSGTFGPFSFSTQLTAAATVAVDGLLISIIPESGTTSVNLDNIQVATVAVGAVPEPGSYSLFACGLGLAGLIRLRPKTTK
jgi:hypothetical protein